jgi:hypothetical protein
LATKALDPPLAAALLVVWKAPAVVAADVAYQNAKENTPHTARLAHDQALAKVMQHLLKDDTEVYKQFVQNESFKRFVTDMVYQLTTTPEGFNKESGP